MLAGTLAFILGVWLVHLTPLHGHPWPLAAVVAGAAVVVAGRVRWVLVALLAGLAWAAWTADQAPRLPAELAGIDLHLAGTVLELPEDESRRSRFLFRVDATDPDYVDTEGIAGATLRLSWYGERPSLRSGQRLAVTVRLREPRGFANPGAFDYSAWLYRQEIAATGYVRSGRITGRQSIGIHQARGHLRERLLQAMGEGRDHPGILLALALGDRQGMRDAEWETLLATGTNHLVAISGLHVGLVAGLVYAGVRRLWGLWPVLPLYWPSAQAAVLAGALAASLYAALAGFSVPTQRALVMLLVGALLVASRRTPDTVRGLALAVWAVLGFDPKTVLEPGFWLSFGAVVVILYSFQGRLRPRSGWRSGARLQWQVSIGLFPLLLGLFGVASLSAPLANLFMVPVVGLLVVPLVLLGALLSLFSPLLGFLPLALADTLLSWLWWPLSWLGAQESLLFRSAAIPVVWLGLGAVGLIGLFGPRGLPGRWVALALLLPIAAWDPPRPDFGEVWVTVLDVGDGQSVLVRTRDHNLVYGTGPRFGAGFEAGGAIVAPHLRHAGVETIHRLVVADSDNGHAGGLEGLLEEVDVKASVVDSGRCVDEPPWEWEGVRLAFKGRECRLHVDAAGGRVVLLPGGDGWPVTGGGARAGDGAERDRLWVPSGAAISRLGSLPTPAAGHAVAVSLEHAAGRFGGHDGHDGHKAGLWRTDRDGALEFRLGGDGLSLHHSERGHRSRPWH